MAVAPVSVRSLMHNMYDVSVTPKRPPASLAVPDPVSLSPGVRRLQMHAAVVERVFAKAPSSWPSIPTPEPPPLESTLDLGDAASARVLGEDVVAQVIGPRIDAFLDEHPAATAQDKATFVQEATAAVDAGFAEAREHLTSLNALDENLSNELEQAHTHSLERLGGLFESMGFGQFSLSSK